MEIYTIIYHLQITGKSLFSTCGSRSILSMDVISISINNHIADIKMESTDSCYKD